MCWGVSCVYLMQGSLLDTKTYCISGTVTGKGNFGIPGLQYVPFFGPSRLSKSPNIFC